MRYAHNTCYSTHRIGCRPNFTDSAPPAIRVRSTSSTGSCFWISLMVDCLSSLVCGSTICGLCISSSGTIETTGTFLDWHVVRRCIYSMVRRNYFRLPRTARTRSHATYHHATSYHTTYLTMIYHFWEVVKVLCTGKAPPRFARLRF